VLDGARFQPGDGAGGDAQHIVGPGGQEQNDHGAHRTGDQGGYGYTGHAHFQTIDAEGVAAKVDQVHNDRNFHGYGAVAGGTEDSRTGVVQGQERERQRRDGKVKQRGVHYVGGDGAEEQPQHGGPQQQAEGGDARAQNGAEGYQLPGAAGGGIGLLGTQILAGDHGTAGGQSRKDG